MKALIEALVHLAHAPFAYLLEDPIMRDRLAFHHATT
jgi:hypothetical protein